MAMDYGWALIVKLHCNVMEIETLIVPFAFLSRFYEPPTL